MEVEKYIPIDLDVLFIGLKNGWLSPSKVVELANKNADYLNCDEDIVIELNVNEGDIDTLITILENAGKRQDSKGTELWHYAFLKNVAQTQKNIEDKLKEIELLWVKFDYPDEWRNFIYYMPIERISSLQEVYHNFLSFLAEKEKQLKISYS